MGTETGREVNLRVWGMGRCLSVGTSFICKASYGDLVYNVVAALIITYRVLEICQE